MANTESRDVMSRLLALYVILFLSLATVCHAQNEHDAALLKTLKAAPSFFETPYHPKLTENDENGNITSVMFKNIKGDFESLLKLEHLKSIELIEMKSGWLERLAKRYPDLEGLSFDASPLTDEELSIVGEFKSLSKLHLTGANSEGTSCISKIGQLTGLESLTIPAGWERHIDELKALKELQSLNTKSKPRQDGRVIGRKDYGIYHHFFRLLVDEQKRSPTEASRVLGILKDGLIRMDGISEQLVPYLNRIETVHEMDLTIDKPSRNIWNSFKVPGSVKKLKLSGYPSSGFLKNVTEANSVEHLAFYGPLEPIDVEFEGHDALKQLYIRHLHIGDQGRTILEGFGGLESLEIWFCDVSKNGLSFLANSKRLKRLKTWECRFAENELKYISGASELKYLQLTNTRLEGFEPQFLSGLIELKLLELGLRNSGLKKFDLRVLSELKALERLSLHGAQLENFHSEVLSELENLSELWLGDAKFKDQHLIHLGSLKKLTKFGGDLSQTTSQGRFKLYKDLNWSLEQSLSAELRNGFQPSSLFIDERVEVSKELLKAISALDSRSSLTVRGNDKAIEVANARPFRKIHFVNCNELNNEAIDSLSTNKDLRSLIIDGSKLVTDDGLQSLEKMTWLEKLSVKNTGVSEAAIEAMKAKLPNCEIK